MSRRPTRALPAALICAALAGCGSTPTAEGPDGAAVVSRPAPAAALSPQSAYEQRQRERAQSLTRQRRLADAALAWEVLAVLRPEAAEYRERLADSQRQIDAAVAERLPRAALAAQRGEIDGATQHYLAILALQPHNEPAAEALRGLERERNKRNHLGKFTRYTLTRRAMADAEMPVSANAMAGSNDVEHAALLAGDGEFDEAIGLLERRLGADRQDAAARRLLANVYYRSAESLLARDRSAAMAAFEKSVRTDPSDPRAAARLKQLKSGAPAPAASAAAADRADARPGR